MTFCDWTEMLEFVDMSKNELGIGFMKPAGKYKFLDKLTSAFITLSVCSIRSELFYLIWFNRVYSKKYSVKKWVLTAGGLIFSNSKNRKLPLIFYDST